MNRADLIKQKLDILHPDYLEIMDDSTAHQGHKGNTTKQESHFIIKISAKCLENKSRVSQHKIINDLLKEEFQKGLHALSIKII